jgi:hypothetical protein
LLTFRNETTYCLYGNFIKETEKYMGISKKEYAIY